MKKAVIMVLVFICSAIVAAKAQSPKVYTIPKDKLKDSAFINRFKNKAFADSLRNTFKYRNNPYGNMPLAGSMPKRLNYIGNNGQGFDIYQTPQDNMYILKPDATFSSNMPVVNSLQMQIKPVEIPNPQKEKKE